MERRSFLKDSGLLLAASSIYPLGNGLSENAKLAGDGKPYHYERSLETSRQIPGFLLNFLVRKEHTNGDYAILEGWGRKGAEPSLHSHEYEDEAFIMLEGEMIVTIGKEDFHVRPGDYIFLPRRIPHTQKFITDSVHVFLIITPAGLEDYFWELSQPAKSFDVPELSSSPPSQEMMEMVMAVNEKYGIKFH